MTHECEKCKSDKMQDLMIDGSGIFYCRSCRNIADDCDVHPEIIRKFKTKYFRK